MRLYFVPPLVSFSVLPVFTVRDATVGLVSKVMLLAMITVSPEEGTAPQFHRFAVFQVPLLLLVQVSAHTSLHAIAASSPVIKYKMGMIQ